MASIRTLAVLMLTTLVFSAAANTARADVRFFNPINGEVLQTGGDVTINVIGKVTREGRNPALILKLRKDGVTLQEDASIELMRRGNFTTSFSGVTGTGVFTIDAFIQGQLKATVVFILVP